MVSQAVHLYLDLPSVSQIHLNVLLRIHLVDLPCVEVNEERGVEIAYCFDYTSKLPTVRFSP